MDSDISNQCAYVTLLTNPSYLPGLLVLQHSLRAVNTKYPLVVMVPPHLDPEARRIIEAVGIKMRDVEALHPRGNSEKLHEDNPRYADTWTKLRAFELVEYARVVLLDVDMLILGDMDGLMKITLESDCIGAVHVCACNPLQVAGYPSDWTPANCAHSASRALDGASSPDLEPQLRPHQLLNSGTVVLRPSLVLAHGLYQFLADIPQPVLESEYKFPDQDLLAAYFVGKWIAIPWYFNALRTFRCAHPDMWGDGSKVRCIHYILSAKPWFSRELPANMKKLVGFEEMDTMWWNSWEEMMEQVRERNGVFYEELKAMVPS